MTMYEEPPIVDIDEILDEQDEDEARATRTQLLLVIVGGVVGVAGLLTLIVVSAPSWLELVRIIGTMTLPDTSAP